MGLILTLLARYYLFQEPARRNQLHLPVTRLPPNDSAIRYFASSRTALTIMGIDLMGASALEPTHIVYERIWRYVCGDQDMKDRRSRR